MAITHYYQIVISLFVNMNKKYKILFISSFPPERSAGLAIDYINALEEVGHEVDFLTLKGFTGQKENQYSIYKQTTSSKLAGMSNKPRALFKIAANQIEHVCIVCSISRYLRKTHKTFRC